ncbi:MAG: hypothetical protein AAB289_00080, partial [Chloroflexota bacterium]
MRFSAGGAGGNTTNLAGTYSASRTEIAGGTANFNANASTTTLSLGAGNSGGTLGGTGDVTIAGLLTWNSGIMTGAGKTFANGGIAINLGGGGATLNGRRLDNAGTATWTNNSSGWSFSNAAVFNNNGTFDVQNDIALGNGGGAASAFKNNGTYRKSAGAGITDINVPFNNTGNVDVQAGTAQFSGGVPSSGPWNVAAPAILEFAGFGQTPVTHNLNAGSAVNGAGTVRFTFGGAGGNTTNLASTYSVGHTEIANAVVNFNTASSTTTLSLGAGNSGGTLGGTGDVTIAGLLTWNSGIMTGAGKTFANGGIAINLGGGGATLNGRRLDNAGLATWTNSSPALNFSNGAVFNNNGTFDVQNDIAINNGGGAASVFNNIGTFRKSAGAGATDINVPFNNLGTVEARSGTLTLTNVLQVNAAASTLTGGTWNVFTNATLTLNSGVNLTTNNGNITLDGATSVFTNIANLLVNNGSFTIQNGHNFIAAGAFSNSGSVTVGTGSTFTTAAGNYAQTGGATTVQGTLDPAGIADIQGGTLTGNNGTIQGNTTNAGTVAPGTSPGTLTVVGDYTQTSAGLLNIEIGGTIPGTQFDRLVITGQANLGGTLNVTRINAFNPALGDNFQIITFASKSGDFATKNGLLLGSGRALIPVYHAADLELQTQPTHLAFVQQPTTTEAGQTISPALTVAIEDSSNNILTFDNSDVVTVAIASGPNGGTLFGTTTATVVNGVATFNNVSIRKAGNYTLGATATNAPAAATSDSFTINPGAATAFVVAGFPSPTTAGDAHNLNLTAQDTFGNTATGYTGTVHFTSTDGQSGLPANSTLTNGGGVFSATLKTAGSQTLTATDTANSSITGTST